VGAAQAFTRVLEEAATRRASLVHAHALIPNHFHFAPKCRELGHTAVMRRLIVLRNRQLKNSDFILVS
jgi:hypothetical protein